jgi:hypothetical protein
MQRRDDNDCRYIWCSSMVVAYTVSVAEARRLMRLLRDRPRVARAQAAAPQGRAGHCSQSGTGSRNGTGEDTGIGGVGRLGLLVLHPPRFWVAEPPAAVVPTQRVWQMVQGGRRLRKGKPQAWRVSARLIFGSMPLRSLLRVACFT